MRLKIDLLPKENFSYQEITSYHVHGLIWNSLKGTEFEKKHEEKKFKFFTYSNIFPITDFKEDEIKSLIIASPNEKFIITLKKKLLDKDEIKLGSHILSIENIKTFKILPREEWQTSTPIVLYEDNRRNLYFSIRRNPSLDFFLSRLKDNALKK
ncbi:MAG TPA: CRISPR-associated endoribonuclease Cas6, partial [Candidatus Altiarchaeales archaeon]|nr:CRISPR-associated endoribonuclease Cas6 [Candidatus Altiarchaeales archaeon]